MRAPCLAAMCTTTLMLGCADQRNDDVGAPSLPAAPRIPVAISAGGSHACALMSDGTVFCWGDNGERQIGDGGGADARAPKRVRHISGAVEVAAGWAHTCARMKDGMVDCWGSNLHGQLGDGSLQGVRQIAAVGDATCAVVSGGSVACWGSGAYGRLGNATEEPTTDPVSVILSEVTSIVAWGASVCARTLGQTVFCWGSSIGGRPGNNGAEYSTVPVRVDDLDHAASIALGNAHACAIWPDGTAGCFGDNHRGQLGDGTTAFHSAERNG